MSPGERGTPRDLLDKSIDAIRQVPGNLRDNMWEKKHADRLNALLGTMKDFEKRMAGLENTLDKLEVAPGLSLTERKLLPAIQRHHESLTDECWKLLTLLGQKSEQRRNDGKKPPRKISAEEEEAERDSLVKHVRQVQREIKQLLQSLTELRDSLQKPSPGPAAIRRDAVHLDIRRRHPGESA